MFTQDSQGKDVLLFNPTEMYEKAWQKGWRGVMPWTSNGVDANGSIADFGSATQTFADNHADLVYPPQTGIDAESAAVPAGLRLFCHPNPFNDSTVIRYHLENPGTVRIIIFDAKGRLQKTIFEGEQSRGDFNLRWDGTDDHRKKLPSGIYLCSMTAGPGRAVAKVIMLD
jgi:hypothetical protein